MLIVFEVVSPGINVDFPVWALRLRISDRNDPTMLRRSQSHGAKISNLFSALAPGQGSRRLGADRAHLCIVHLQSYRHICT